MAVGEVSKGLESGRLTRRAKIFSRALLALAVALSCGLLFGSSAQPAAAYSVAECNSAVSTNAPDFTSQINKWASNYIGNYTLTNSCPSQLGFSVEAPGDGSYNNWLTSGMWLNTGASSSGISITSWAGELYLLADGYGWAGASDNYQATMMSYDDFSQQGAGYIRNTSTPSAWVATGSLATGTGATSLRMALNCGEGMASCQNQAVVTGGVFHGPFALFRNLVMITSDTGLPTAATGATTAAKNSNFSTTWSGADAGAGLTSATLKLDGSQVDSQAGSCASANGYYTQLKPCSASLSKAYTVSASTLSEGSHTLLATSTDLQGNVGTSSTTFTVDRTAPTATWVPPSSPTNSASLSYTLNFSESISGLTSADFSNTGTATGCVITPSASTGTSVTVSVASCSAGTVILTLATGSVQDAAGNNGPGSSIADASSVVIDRTAPTATWTATPSSPASAASLSYTLTFSEAVTGLTSADFSNAGTATGCVFTPSASSGSSMTVSVTSCSAGTVVLRLAANAVTDTAGNTGPGAVASGGTVTDITSGGTNYRVHSFTSSGTFTSSSSLTADYLVVAGGGGASTGSAGGGGGGGVRQGTWPTLTSGAYAVTVGAGGNKGGNYFATPYTNQDFGTVGGNSSMNSLTAGGGGFSGAQNAPASQPTTHTGSGGGGGGGTNQPSQQTAGAAGSNGLATAGAAGVQSSRGGGGGGASAAGSGVSGGAGYTSSITGSAVVYGSGGGAGVPSGTPGVGGSGAGNGGLSNTQAATDAVANRGGGGGGGGNTLAPHFAYGESGNGGSGVVIVRYALTPSATGALDATSVTIDTAPPTASWTSTPASPSNSASLSYILTFSETVSGLTSADFSNTGTATGCVFTPSASSGSSMTITVSSCSNGTLILRLAASGVNDTAGNTGPAANLDASSVTVDRTAPTATWAATPSSPSNSSSLSYTLTFSEAISGLTSSDFSNTGSATGCAFTASAASGSSMTVTVASCSAGTVVLRLAASSVADSAGNGGPATAAAASSVTVDRTAPTASWTAAPSSPSNSASLSYTLTFSEAISGLTAADFSNTGTATGCVFTPAAASGSSMAITVSSCSAGTVVLRIAAAAVSDAASNTGPTTALSASSVSIDRTAPTASWTATPSSPTNSSSLSYTLTFSEAISGLAAADFSNAGTATGCVFTPSASSGSSMTVVLSSCSSGTVILRLAANAVNDVPGNPGPVSTPVASGGTVTDINSGGTNYRVHTFTSSGTFIANSALTAGYLVVGGGGGGGGGLSAAGNSGGGGAGGLRSGSSSLAAGSTAITVGAGGAAGSGQTAGTNGSSSSFASTVASGGGGGGAWSSVSSAGQAGGSGGGAGQLYGGSISVAGGAGNSGAFSPVEGYAGGTGNGVSTGNYSGMGGGGAAAAAASFATLATPTPGGAGVDWNGVTYAGGGGGSAHGSYVQPGLGSVILSTTGSYPWGITIDSAGNVYTANYLANNVSKITPGGVSAILGTTGTNPMGITLDSSGNVYTANYTSNNVSKITPAGVSTVLGTAGTKPGGITIDSSGNVYTANFGSANVSKITPAGVSTILGTTGDGAAGIAIDSAGNVYTANQIASNVTKITAAGVSSTLSTTGTGPRGIVVDSAGNVYTANQNASNVTKITAAGVSSTLGTTGATPRALAMDSSGNLYTSDNGANKVTKITSGTPAYNGGAGGGGNGAYTASSVRYPATAGTDGRGGGGGGGGENTASANGGSGVVIVRYALTSSATGALDASSITVDSVAPTATWTSTPSSYTSTSPLSYTLTFSEAVAGLTAADFSNTGSATGCVFTPSAASGSSMTVSVSSCSEGTVVLRLAASGVSDTAGNTGPATNLDASSVTLDRVAPTASWTSTPASPTNSASLSYILTFSEAVSGLTASDFSNAGTATGCAFTPSAASGSSITVTVASCSEGTVILGLSSASVVDSASNIGPAAGLNASSVTVDRTAPTASWTAIPSSPASSASLSYTLTFSETISGLTAADFSNTGTATGCAFTASAASGSSMTDHRSTQPLELLCRAQRLKL